jgi:3-hydroxyisobutyrate dehydrogenase
MIQHAVVDAIYAADLCRSRGLPALATIPMAAIALAFAHVLTKYEGTPLSTHAIVREMIRENAADLDGFINNRLHYNDMATSIQNAIDVLPEKVKASVRLDISEDDFQ